MKFVKFLQGFMYDDISGGIASPLEFGCNTQMIFAKISVKVTDQKMGRAKIVNRKSRDLFRTGGIRFARKRIENGSILF